MAPTEAWPASASPVEVRAWSRKVPLEGKSKGAVAGTAHGRIGRVVPIGSRATSLWGEIDLVDHLSGFATMTRSRLILIPSARRRGRCPDAREPGRSRTSRRSASRTRRCCPAASGTSTTATGRSRRSSRRARAAPRSAGQATFRRHRPVRRQGPVALAGRRRQAGGLEDRGRGDGDPARGAGSGTITSKDEFGDCQLHLEFATPVPAQGPRPGPRQQRRRCSSAATRSRCSTASRT